MNFGNEEQRPYKIITKLESITVENIKCVRKGTIKFRTDGKSPYSNDIIGIYGQNGSGKSTLVEVLKTLKALMTENSREVAKSEVDSDDKDYLEGKFLQDLFFSVQDQVEGEEIKDAKIQAVFNIFEEDSYKLLRAEYNLLFQKIDNHWSLSEEKLQLSKYNEESESWGKKAKLFSYKNPQGFSSKRSEEMTFLNTYKGTTVPKQEIIDFCVKLNQEEINHLENYLILKPKYIKGQEVDTLEDLDAIGFLPVKFILNHIPVFRDMLKKCQGKNEMIYLENFIAEYLVRFRNFTGCLTIGLPKEYGKQKKLLERISKIAPFLSMFKKVKEKFSYQFAGNCFNEIIAHNISIEDSLICFEGLSKFANNIVVFTNMGVTDEVLRDIVIGSYSDNRFNLLKNKNPYLKINPLIPQISLVEDSHQIHYEKFCENFNKIISHFVPKVQIAFGPQKIKSFTTHELLPIKALKEIREKKGMQIPALSDIADIITSVFVRGNPFKFRKQSLYTLQVYRELAIDIARRISQDIVEVCKNTQSNIDIEALYSINKNYKVSCSFAYNKVTGLPLSLISNGTKKILSWVSALVEFYNDPSKLCVIDEFDAGIFEFLLGELLKLLQKRGQGQLLFTSHNLRPLEVLNQKSIYFTTANPFNKYYQLKNIKPTHNLRDSYFRAIILGGQKESIYTDTDMESLAMAFYEAGGAYGK